MQPGGDAAGGGLRQRAGQVLEEEVAAASVPGAHPPTSAVRSFVATTEVDWSDPSSVVRYHVDYRRALSGDRPFDEPAYRDLVRRDVARARDIAAMQNHDLVAGVEGPDHHWLAAPPHARRGSTSRTLRRRADGGGP
ncbi:hypothetical protein [Dactylosporangium sp. CA-139066]|uniref:hypothetical protein n=1 Tax=Dactylosporangium sp. CA-139066 TaxID=3239930 RepID=UPI003D945CEC